MGEFSPEIATRLQTHWGPLRKVQFMAQSGLGRRMFMSFF